MTRARLLFAACFVLSLLALAVLVYFGARAEPAPLLPETPPGSAGIVGTATADPSKTYPETIRLWTVRADRGRMKRFLALDIARQGGYLEKCGLWVRHNRVYGN